MDTFNGETLHDITNVSLVHHGKQALRAHILFQRDTDYIAKDDAIVIIDEFTGRMMEDAVFPKAFIRPRSQEGHRSERTNPASITFQNYFRLGPNGRHDRHRDENPVNSPRSTASKSISRQTYLRSGSTKTMRSIVRQTKNTTRYWKKSGPARRRNSRSL